MDADLPPLSIRETAVLAAQFAVVWFIANWSFVAAMGLTTVASGTTLGSASGFFTLLVGFVWGVERASVGKLLSVVLSFVGIALIAQSDAVHGEAPVRTSRLLAGDFFALLSALSYAVYVTLLKKRICSEDRISMPLFLGFVGAFNLLAFWPIGILLDLTGVEKLALPHDARTWIGLAVNMLITVVADLAYLLAMLKSSPLFTTIGLSLTIPMALVGDVWYADGATPLRTGLGAMLVLVRDPRALRANSQASFATVAWDDNTG